MSKHVYLGPYVECTYKSATRTDNVWGCTNEACKKHPKKIQPDAEGKFCSACGSANGKIAIKVKDWTDRYDVVGDELHELIGEGHGGGEPETLFLAPNGRRKGDPTPDTFDDMLNLDLRDVDPRAQMAWFEDAYAKELTKLRKAYATVEVKWGLHIWVM